MIRKWMTNTCRGILEVNEDTETPGTFAAGRERELILRSSLA